MLVSIKMLKIKKKFFAVHSRTAKVTAHGKGPIAHGKGYFARQKDFSARQRP